MIASRRAAAGADGASRHAAGQRRPSAVHSAPSRGPSVAAEPARARRADTVGEFASPGPRTVEATISGAPHCGAAAHACASQTATPPDYDTCGAPRAAAASGHTFTWSHCALSAGSIKQARARRRRRRQPGLRAPAHPQLLCLSVSPPPLTRPARGRSAAADAQDGAAGRGRPAGRRGRQGNAGVAAHADDRHALPVAPAARGGPVAAVAPGRGRSGPVGAVRGRIRLLPVLPRHDGRARRAGAAAGVPGCGARRRGPRVHVRRHPRAQPGARARPARSRPRGACLCRPPLPPACARRAAGPACSGRMRCGPPCQCRPHRVQVLAEQL
jgi:hypothetical protein